MKETGVVTTLHGMVTSNLNNKGMALVLAILIWAFAFNNTKGEERLTNVRLNIVVADSSQAIVVSQTITDSENVREIGRTFTGEVTITLSGQVSQLRKLRERAWGSIPYPVTVSEDINLRSAEIYGLPSGVDVVFATPRTVHVEVNPLIEMIRAIVVIPKGDPGPGLTLPKPENITVNRSSWTIVGPSDQVRDMENIKIYVDFEGVVDETLATKMKLPALPDLVSYKDHERGAPPEVTVTATLEQNHVERQVDMQLRFAFVAGLRSVVNHSRSIKLYLSGAPQELDALERRIEQGKQWAFVLPKAEAALEGATGIIGPENLQFAPGLPRTIRVDKVAGSDQSYKYDVEFK